MILMALRNRAMLPKLVILDRDGVINEDSDQYIKSPAEWIPVPGSLEAISKLNTAGILVGVATNQSGIARGYYDEQTLADMHEKMRTLLAECGGHVNTISYCPHRPDDGCACRKPKPGMLLDIMQEMDIPKANAIFIGDTLGDMQAAKNAAIDFALVRTGKGKRTLRNNPDFPEETPVFQSLADYVNNLFSDIP